LKKRKVSLNKSVFLICVFIPLFIYSCGDEVTKYYTYIGSAGDDNYKTFITQKDVTRFSFEYPTYYEIASYQPMPDYPVTSMILVGPSTEEEKGNIKHLEIHVTGFSSDAKAEMEWRISDYRSSVMVGATNDFKIIEKNQVIVAGASGWEIIFSFKQIPVLIHGLDDIKMRDKPIQIISRYLYLEHQEMVWEISLYSDAKTYDQTKSDYEHTIQTFRFLD
jgi:hypothetical protein